MAIFRIEVFLQGATQHRNKWVSLAQQLGIHALTGCTITRLFFIEGALTPTEVEGIASHILADPVTEGYRIGVGVTDDHNHTLEVTYLPGVTDTEAESLLGVLHRLGKGDIQRVATGRRYRLQGDLTTDDLHQLAVKVFCNPTIQRYALNATIAPPFVNYPPANDHVERIPLCAADDQGLLDISAARRLSLDLNEMQAIQGYYQAQGREPTDVELEMIAQTWSEHCVHKTFKADIYYQAGDQAPQLIQGLLKSYIRKATEQLAKPWVYSAFVDNAGIMRFDETWDIAFKVETHNHPSAIEPFGGANTGVGGVIRDVLGVSARPIANTDVLCFGPQDLPNEALPSGSLHPRYIEEGVVHGIEDYGNKMGIPTVNGAVFYHQGYTANPLVFCGCLGLLPHNSNPTRPQAGDYIVVMGGRTGRDGLRGATFSSMEMDDTTSTVAGSAVQIGHPIHEKQVLEVILQARDQQLYHAITDCGAGGLSSAIGELGADLGATVQLQTVPLKYSGLSPWEIWLSEAQERMVLAVGAETWPQLQALCARHEVEATCIGVFEPTGRLILHYGEHVVGEVDMQFLHAGIPTRQLTAVWTPPPLLTTPQIAPQSIADSLLTLLAHPNIRSKEAIIRRYDHEVQGGGVVKPLVGAANHGPSDATVLVPLGTAGKRGVSLANGICPAYGELDPYVMAWAAIDEAMRNSVAVGADPDQIAILDNFCWGNPNLPDRLGSLVRCVEGCHDAALAYGTPFISGKDSLNNEYTGENGQRYAIPGTLLISAVGVVPDIQHTVTMDLKQAGNILYLIGETRAELGGSYYHQVNGLNGGLLPQPNPNALHTLRQLHCVIQNGLIRACHDCSEGGLAVTVAEMCIAGGIGARLDLPPIAMPSETYLFSESLTRWVVEVQPEDVTAFEALLHDIPHTRIGFVEGEHLIVDDGRLVSLAVGVLTTAWRGNEALGHTTPHPITPPTALAVPSVRTRRPKVMILHARGTNRDREAALACELAGGAAEVTLVQELVAGERNLLDYQMLVIPGGFSYGDDLGAGVLWALDIQDRLRSFIETGRPVLGICNGFQALVKAGLLPGMGESRKVTLTHNQSGHFECRWVYLKPNPLSRNLFTDGLETLVYCPVAHGEGRVRVADEPTRQQLWQDGLVALTYVGADGQPTDYPANPNGSIDGIAALVNPAGNVLGLMPHPEDHIFAWQHPRWHRGESGMLGSRLFENAIKNA